MMETKRCRLLACLPFFPLSLVATDESDGADWVGCESTIIFLRGLWRRGPTTKIMWKASHGHQWLWFGYKADIRWYPRCKRTFRMVRRVCPSSEYNLDTSSLHWERTSYLRRPKQSCGHVSHYGLRIFKGSQRQSKSQRNPQAAPDRKRVCHGRPGVHWVSWSMMVRDVHIAFLLTGSSGVGGGGIAAAGGNVGT